MPGALIQIVYTSTATVHIDEQTLRSIQAAALRNNSKRGITGLLLYGSGRFFHFFEGPPEPTDTLFERIKADNRHKDVHLLFRRESHTRSLDFWSMGVLNLEDMDSHDNDCLRELDRYAELMSLATCDQDADTLTRLITGIFQRYTSKLSRRAS